MHIFENSLKLKKMKIAIVEDEIAHSDLIISYINKYFSENNTSINPPPKTFKVFTSGKAFLFDEEYYDLIFLDIELKGELNGIETGRKLREKNKTSQIIIVTNLAQYAINGYEIDAMAFCLKPLSYPDFYMQFKRFINKMNNKLSFKCIFEDVNTGSKIILESEDIIYIGLDKHYLIYKTKDNDYKSRGNIKECYNTIISYYSSKNIKTCPFFKINSGTIVNMNYVAAINDNIVIINGDRLNISRTNYKEFLSVFSDFISKN